MKNTINTQSNVKNHISDVSNNAAILKNDTAGSLKAKSTFSQLTQSGSQARLNGGTRIIVPRDRVFNVARDLAGQDEYVRVQAKGKHFSQIISLVRSAFHHMGVNVQEADMNRYAQAVHEGRDYRFVVAF